jgi:hypothetical protein
VRFWLDPPKTWWDYRFSRRRVWRWLSSGMLHRVVIVLMMETVRTSETLVSFYQTTRRNIPEDGHLRQTLFPSVASCALYCWLIYGFRVDLAALVIQGIRTLHCYRLWTSFQLSLYRIAESADRILPRSIVWGSLIFEELTSWSEVLLEKLLVSQLVQEISRRNPNVHCPFHKIQPQIAILCQMNPVHTLISFSLTINFSISSHLRLVARHWLLTKETRV